jgi:class 3 adenylate cyclase
MLSVMASPDNARLQTADLSVLSPDAGALELLVGRDRYSVDLARGPAVWTFGIAVLVLVATAVVRSAVAGFQPVPIAIMAASGVIAAPVTFVWGPRWPRGVLLAVWLLAFSVFVAGVGMAGPQFGESAALLPAAVSTSGIWFSRRWAVVFLAVTAVGYGVVLGIGHGYAVPAARWIYVVGIALAINALLRWLIARIHHLAEDERRAAAEVRRLAEAESEARRSAETARSELEVANRELAGWGRTLEQRVQAQVTEIEGLNRLRRFLSPQVAEAVLQSVSSGDQAILQPHRRQIAVVFIDLRGFTAFAGTAEPEEVVEVLDAYYRVVGDQLHRYDATVGAFAGDGIMAFLGDPVPRPDPAGSALAMVLDLRAPMKTVTEAWNRRGFGLDYGVGIAYGYATLGTIGFEGRSDYTALGSVVNLSARLCAEARPGEILVDGKAYAAGADRLTAEAREVSLKGFSAPVTVFRVLGSHDDGLATKVE